MLRAWTDTDTWNSFLPVAADAVAVLVAITGFVNAGLLTIDVTASLTTWLGDPASNLGWAVVSTGIDGVGYFSAGGTTPPRLVVEFIGGSSSALMPVSTPLLMGDMSGDGMVNLADVSLFVMALVNPSAYAAAYPHLDADQLGDVDASGTFDLGDLPVFVASFGTASFGSGSASAQSSAKATPSSANMATSDEASLTDTSLTDAIFTSTEDDLLLVTHRNAELLSNRRDASFDLLARSQTDYASSDDADSDWDTALLDLLNTQ